MRRNSLKLVVAVVAVSLLSACGSKDDKKATTQAVARVNGAEITVHQVNQVLSRLPGVTEENVARARKEVLDKLIEQQLAIEQAEAAKLDRQPEVVAAIEAARREVVARAYLDQLVAKAKPGTDEARKYYGEHPELFSQRKIYNLQEIALEKNDSLLPALREKVAASRNLEDVAAWLKERDVKFSAQGGVRPAEQISLEILPALHGTLDGRSAVFATPGGILVTRVVATKPAPVDEATALPRIQQFLGNQRGKELVTAELKQLRDKAKIEFLGAFADAAPAATPAAPAAPAAPAEAAPNAGNAAKAVGGLK